MTNGPQQSDYVMQQAYDEATKAIRVTTIPASVAGAIADVAGGATVDAQARTAINAILVVLRDLNLIDP